MTLLTQELRRLEHELSEEERQLADLMPQGDRGSVEWHCRRILRDARRIGSTAEQIADRARRLMQSNAPSGPPAPP